MDDPSLKDVVQQLEKLQETDLEIFELNASLEEIPKALAALKTKLAELQEQIERDKVTSLEAEKYQKEHEKAIEMQRELLAKSKAKLANARNEREANAAQREIETIKRSLNEREEEALHILEVLEQTAASIQQKEERFRQLEAEYLEVEQASQKNASGMEERRKKLTEERQRLRKAIVHRNLDIYEKIRLRRPRAIVSVIRGICQGCHMMLPPQTYNLLLRGDKLIQCPNCHRIVYCSDDESCGRDCGGK